MSDSPGRRAAAAEGADSLTANSKTTAHEDDVERDSFLEKVGGLMFMDQFGF